MEIIFFLGHVNILKWKDSIGFCNDQWLDCWEGVRSSGVDTGMKPIVLLIRHKELIVHIWGSLKYRIISFSSPPPPFPFIRYETQPYIATYDNYWQPEGRNNVAFFVSPTRLARLWTMISYKLGPRRFCLSCPVDLHTSANSLSPGATRWAGKRPIHMPFLQATVTYDHSTLYTQAYCTYIKLTVSFTPELLNWLFMIGGAMLSIPLNVR